MNRRERFMTYVNVHSGKACWNWAGGVSGNGYGQFWNGERTIPAHHFLLDEPVPKGKLACHKCDNPLCVRPSHIFIGTYADNMRDCAIKRRFDPAKRSGARNPAAKLTETQVRLIRNAPRSKGMIARFAKQFGVCERTISGVRYRHHWKTE